MNDSEAKEILEIVSFMKERMATKEDVADIVEEKLKPLEVRLTAVEMKLAGIDSRLDVEAGVRDDLKIPTRVADLEVESFGASRAPQMPTA